MTALEASIAPPVVADLLYQNYDPALARQALIPRTAVLPDAPGEVIPYLRVNEGGGQPAMYIHGFSENLVARMPFALELAQRDFDITMAGENRARLPRNLQNRADGATTMQAISNLAVMNQARVEAGAAIVTHSYGSQVFEKMLMLEEADGRYPFETSQVVMIAPAGMIKRESLPRITYGAFKTLHQEKRVVRGQDFPELFKPASASSQETQRENLRRSLRECWGEIPRLQLDYKAVADRVGQLTLLLYPEDALFPYKLQEPALEDALQYGITIMAPWQIDKRGGGLRSYGGEGATHDDEIFNPGRVAGALQSVLKRRSVNNNVTSLPLPVASPVSERLSEDAAALLLASA